MTQEIDTVEQFDAHLTATGSLRNTACHGIDLRERTWRLVEADLAGAAFLGCLMEPSALEAASAAGALVFPEIPELPYRMFRSSLYDPAELFAEFDADDELSYERCLDQRVYRWYEASRAEADILAELAQRIHDHSIDDALANITADARIVAIMGGHSMGRDEPGYRDVAHLARRLAQGGLIVASGGGPGAMEAANLGPRFTERTADELDDALDLLAQAPRFEEPFAWLSSAFAVRDQYPVEGEPALSLGVPTWHYGHEPPNAFATWVAKYFANSIREEGLLAIATAGVIFAPGSAGTIQEVFQDATQNHYNSFGIISPMVFFGEEFWTETKPVYPLLRHLAEGYDYAEKLSISDSIDEIVASILG